MIVVTLLAIVLGLSVSVGAYILPWFVMPIIWFAMPTVLVACALYGGGVLQAFAVGGLVPVVISLFGRGMPSSNPVYVYFCGGFCGILAVIVRQWLIHVGPR